MSRAERFRWEIDGRAARLAQLYLVEGLSPVEIAARIGEGCTAKAVRRRVSAERLVQRRDPAITAAHRLRNLATARETSPVAYSFGRRHARAVAPQPIPDNWREMAAEAIAAGKVTILQPGVACGLAAWETALYTCPAPVPGQGDKAAALAAHGRRGQRKSLFYHASRGGGR